MVYTVGDAFMTSTKLDQMKAARMAQRNFWAHKIDREGRGSSDAEQTEPRAKSCRPLRLLVVGNGPTGVDEGGAWHVDRTVGDFLVEVAEAGHEVVFLQTLEPLALELNNFGRVLPKEKVRAISLDKRRVASAVRTSLQAVRALLRADFIYLFFSGRLPRLVEPLCRLLGKPLGIYVRADDFERGGKDAELFRRARFVLAASQGIADQVRALGADVRLFRPMCDVSAADAVVRDHRAPRPGPLHLLFVGQMIASKGALVLIEAVRIVRSRGLAVEAKLVGSGDLYDQLARRFPPGNDAGVQLLGTVDDQSLLMRLYEEADLFVLPTYFREGFPRVLYEAMIKSAVVITTEVAGIPALMKHEENCLTVPIKDAEAVAAAIERLAADPALRQRLADAAMRSAIDVLENYRTHSEVLLDEIESLEL